MLRTAYLRGFIEPARRGITMPVIVRARDEEGVEDVFYLKTTAGYGDRPAAAGVELFTTLIARRMGLRAPEPVVVVVPEGAERLVFDAPQHAALIRQSVGMNFATVALGADWKTWLPGLSTRRFPEATVENILAFDALVQHTDREAANPNLMWREAQIAVLDHEKVFGYLSLPDAGMRPWRAFFQRRPFARHVLQPEAQRLMGPDFGKAVWEAVLELDLGGGFDECQRVAEAAFPAAQVDLARIRMYLSTLAENAGDFFDYLKAALTR